MPQQFKVTVEHTIEEQRVKDLLCCALEGGSNYWYAIEEYRYPDGMTRKDVEFPHLDLPFLFGGAIIIVDREETPSRRYILDIAAIKHGLQVMADRFPNDFSDFLSENDDANTGDTFLQCCLFGNVIYT